MAQKTNKQETRTSIEELNENLTSVEQKVENNPKIIMWSLIGVVAVAAIVIGGYFWIDSNRTSSTNAISEADMAMMEQNDSIALQKYQAVASEYSNANGSRAALESAIILFNQKKYQEAINYLDKASFSDDLIAASSKSLKGDCLVNLDKFDEAIACFDKAISESGDNALYTPLFMMKKATVLEAQKKFADAKAIYEKIQKDYPEFENTYGASMDTYISRAEGQVK